MEKFCLMLLFFAAITPCYSQLSKRTIDTTHYGNWPSAGDPALSNDGKYFMYNIRFGLERDPRCVIRATDKKWTLDDFDGLFFTSDSKKVVCRSGNELSFFYLDTKVREPIASVSALTQNISHTWMACRPVQDKHKLLVQSLTAKSRITLDNVLNYTFSPSGSFLIIESLSEDKHELYSLSLDNFSKNLIFSTSDNEKNNALTSLSFDSSDKFLAFFVKNDIGLELYLFDLRENKGCLFWRDILLDDNRFEVPTGQTIKFSDTGDKLYFNIKLVDTSSTLRSELRAIAEVWNTNSENKKYGTEGTGKTQYLSVVKKGEDQVIILENANDQFKLPTGNVGDYILSSSGAYVQDFWWHPEFHTSLTLISTTDGSRKAILNDCKHLVSHVNMSPLQRFVVWFDLTLKQYFCYEIATSKLRAISAGYTYPLFDDEKVELTAQAPFGPAGWTKDDSGFIVYDRYDLVQLDTRGQIPPINLTDGYGRKHQLVLAPALSSRDNIFADEATILLSGFNRRNKLNGFFEAKLGSGIKPLGALTSDVYCIPRTVPKTTGMAGMFGDFRGFPPVKAKEANAYVIMKMSATKSPNYFFTTDFKAVKQMSFLTPESNVNWLSTELISWQSSDGQESQGILYKPENFLQNHKYPLLVYLYEEQSDALNVYLKPDYSSYNINIPQYVSNGYLVFVPDIKYSGGMPGESALAAVKAGLTQLCKRKYVDTAKLGIEGMSFGGFETNYIISHSNIFAAACSGAGVADQISAYGGKDGLSQWIAEQGQVKLLWSPFEKPLAYIRNSPVFDVAAISTPLLLWTGLEDKSVDPSQSHEMFFYMRRARKQAWLLRYKGQGHGLLGASAKDLDRKMREFFDYHLKGEAAPKWMLDK